MSYMGINEMIVKIMGHPVEISLDDQNLQIGYSDGSDGPLVFRSTEDWSRFKLAIDQLLAAARVVIEA